MLRPLRRGQATIQQAELRTTEPQRAPTLLVHRQVSMPGAVRRGGRPYETWLYDARMVFESIAIRPSCKKKWTSAAASAAET
jgi:hypothetical protein